MDNKNPFNNINNYLNEENILNNILESNNYDILNFNKNNDKKLFCINCGKYGHVSKKCLCPIISIGIICIKINSDKIDLNSIISYSKKIQNNYLFSGDELIKLNKFKNIINNIDLNNYDELIEYLLIRRKNSLNYVELIRGKYDINNLDYLEKSINFLTIEEREMVQKHTFDYLWKDLWGEDITNNNNNEYNESMHKFNILKNGMYIKKNDINLYISLDKLISESIFNYTEPEWGFPKGRRNSKEKNIECAKREFEEETDFKNDLYYIINMSPIEETYLATNNLKYKHIYYIAQSKSKDINIYLDKNNKDQNIEIGDIRWMKFKDAFKIIRDYNIEKKNVLLNIHYNIKYTIENFKKLLEDDKIINFI